MSGGVRGDQRKYIKPVSSLHGLLLVPRPAFFVSVLLLLSFRASLSLLSYSSVVYFTGGRLLVLLDRPSYNLIEPRHDKTCL